MSEKVAVLKWVGAGAALMLAGALLAGAQEAAVLDSVVITADQERADGPVQGYRAKRTRSATVTDTPIEEIPQSISVVPASVLDDPTAREWKGRWTSPGALHGRTTSAALRCTSTASAG